MRFPHISFLRNDASGICGDDVREAFRVSGLPELPVPCIRSAPVGRPVCRLYPGGRGWHPDNGCVHPGVPSTGGIGYARPHTNSFLSYETIVTVPFPSKTHRIILVRSLPQYPFFRLCWLQTYKEAYNTDGILVQKL